MKQFVRALVLAAMLLSMSVASPALAEGPVCQQEPPIQCG
jgi:hypothetical protein